MSKLKSLGLLEIFMALVNSCLLVSIGLIFSPFDNFQTGLYIILLFGFLKLLSILIGGLGKAQLIITALLFVPIALYDLGMNRIEFVSYGASILLLWVVQLGFAVRSK